MPDNVKSGLDRHDRDKSGDGTEQQGFSIQYFPFPPDRRSRGDQEKFAGDDEKDPSVRDYSSIGGEAEADHKGVEGEPQQHQAADSSPSTQLGSCDPLQPKEYVIP